MIEIRNIQFRYPGSGRGIGSLSCHIEDGEKVAITGPSGCGKSTLLRLLMGLYEPDEGQILWNGIALSSEERRRLSSYVPQEASIFTATIYENIVWARPEATYEEVEKAARKAHIHEFIKSLHEGYDTQVSARSLSGGQKQRIAIARAILKGTKVVLLDEITSSLDPGTGEAILNEISKIWDGCTVVLVTHDMRAMEYVNREIRIE